MKTVISFDVGMKNLAYCLFQIDLDNTDNTSNELHKFKVLKWDVINLCSPIIRKCNNGGIEYCKDEAKYCKVTVNKNTITNQNNISDNDDHDNNDSDNDVNIECATIGYYCNKHAKKCSTFKVPPSELDIKKIKKQKLIDIKNIIEKYNIKDTNNITSTFSNTDNCENVIIQPATKRQKNNKEQLLDIIQEELNKKYLQPIENIRANEIDLLTLGKNMMIELDKFVVKQSNIHEYNEIDMGGLGDIMKYKIDIVIIENQISTIASRMKTLQGMLAQYFIMKDVPCIEFISASNKLKMFMTKKKTTYTERKLESVEVTKELLEKLPQLKEYKGILDKNKKKDDLADCFLQGIYYLTIKNMINIDV
jgi:hypothetical protein